MLAAPAILRAQTVQKLSFYYPIAVGGPIPAMIDGYCRDFQKESGIEVTPVYAGNYGDTLTKAVTAIKAGQGPQLAILLAAEMHSLQDMDILASLDDMGLDADGKAWVDCRLLPRLHGQQPCCRQDSGPFPSNALPR